MSSFFKQNAAVLLLAAAMVWLAYAVGGGVCLVPVLPALVCRGFQTGGGRFSLLELVCVPSFAALVGWGVANSGAGSLTAHLLLAYAAVSLLLAIGKSRLFEAYAVALVPVFIFNRQLKYVCVVAAYLLAVALARGWVARGVCVAGGAWGGPGRLAALKRYALQAALLLPLFAVEFVQGNYFLLLPCLFYAFAMLCEEGGRFYIGQVETDYLCLQVFAAVLVGALADMAVMSALPALALPETGAVAATAYAAAAVAVLAFLMRAFGGGLFPPVLGMAMFPFLRDGDVAFVFAVDVAFVYMLVAALAYKRILLKINWGKGQAG